MKYTMHSIVLRFLYFAIVVSCCRAVIAQDGPQTLLKDGSDGHPPAADQQRAQLRQPVPAAAASRQALAEVKDIFRDDYAKAITPQARSAFARQLLAQVEKTPAAAERWALLSEAMRLASDAGDVDLCFETIDNTGSCFAIDTDDYKLDAISKLAVKAPPQAIDGLARAALTISKKATDVGNSVAASKGLSLAASLARKAKNRALVAEVAKIQQSARDQDKEAKERAAIEGRLAAQPTDPEVCLEAGKYFCFKADDWERGLPLLAKSSDTTLSRLATAEANTAETIEAVISLADAWWNWAERERGVNKAAGMVHAADLYATVVPKLQGLDRTKLEKRIQQAGNEPTGREQRVALADLKEESATGMQYGFSKDGTFKGKPFTCCGKQWPKGLTAMTHDKGTSIIYKLPAGAKRLVGSAGVFCPDGAGSNQHPGAPIVFEILLDGRSAWKSAALAEQNNTAEFAVELYGATTLELRSKSNSPSGAWSAWLNPEITY